MHRLSSFVAALILLVMMMPVLACAATPTMTRMERDCCGQMHGKCGEMTKQGCCAIEVRSDLVPLRAHMVAVPVVSLTMIAILYLWPADLPVALGYRWQIPEEHSPPGLIIADAIVLRI